mmetsp:Transcript_13864/g.60550  ORF Transcript_13864/g.60550 Transcript_13864/m.60550 type:complete len:117 (+) Transcript_13864:1150-1500(+)
MLLTKSSMSDAIGPGAEWVDRTQPFKLTIYFKTEGTPSASLYITHTLNKFCHLDIHVGLFYHSEDAACVGYVDSLGAKRHFEYRPSDGNSLPCIPKDFLDRFSIENRFKKTDVLSL